MKLILPMVATMWALSAYADPTYFPDRPDELRKIINNTNSTILADDKDPATFWVLPPVTGKADAHNFRQAGANVGFCREMSDIQGYSRRLSAKIAELNEKIATREPEAIKKKEDYTKAQEEEAKFVSSSTAIRDLDSMTGRVDDIEARLTSNYDRLNSCEEPLCSEITSENKELNSEKKQLAQDIRKIRMENFEDVKKYDQLKRKTAAKKSAYDLVFDDLDKLAKGITDAKEALFGSYKTYAALEGGYSSMVFTSSWDDNVTVLNQEHAHLGYNFKKVPTKNAQIFASYLPSSGRDSYYASLPMILDYSVNGIQHTAGYKEEKDLLPAYPGDFSGSIRLSLIGACPIIHPEIFDLPKGNNGVPVFGTAVAFDFPAAFETKIRFSYNLYRFYELIKESGSKGGFFSSRSWSKTTETRIEKGTFEAHWEESDPDNLYTEEMRRQVETQIKEELINRVMARMAVPVNGPAVDMSAAPAIPPRGAIVLAKGLEKTCGWYSYYCTGGAWALRIADAIFGSSTMTSHFRQTYDFTETETWSRQSTRWKPAITSFIPQK